MFEFEDKKYNDEQEIIEAGVQVIYYYCFNVRGRWRDIEHLMVENFVWGYWYVVDVIKGRYEPELEAIYVMRHSGRYHVRRYIEDLVRYGNV